MDNKKWKTLRRRSPEVDVFTTNDAAKALAKQAAATQGIVSEAFLNAQKGEKVAFLEKTSSYLHAGSGKFDKPFTKGEAWQGEPEFDESSQTYAVQVSVPVFDPADAKKAIGVLVVGLNLTQMAKPAPAK
ncbi:MAG: PDC sensor domain-containing protein [Planctomycetes bacterium]|nr:PDC sensor domain-containing protein [Planctomycetota bacterium]